MLKTKKITGDVMTQIAANTRAKLAPPRRAASQTLSHTVAAPARAGNSRIAGIESPISVRLIARIQGARGGWST